MQAKFPNLKYSNAHWHIVKPPLKKRSTTVHLLSCYNEPWHPCIKFLNLVTSVYALLRTNASAESKSPSEKSHYRGITNLMWCWCIFLKQHKQTLVRTVQNSRLLFSLSLSLGLPASVACNTLKDTSCRWRDAGVIEDDHGMHHRGPMRVFLGHQPTICLVNYQGNWYKGYFVKVCAPIEGCRGTCPRRSATNDEFWPASD